MTTLKIRSKGDSVRLLQELLNKSGFNIKVDGKFGSKTDKAVREFQKKNNLIVDGIVGPKTWTVLSNKNQTELKKADKKFLCEKDLVDVAKQLQIEVPVIKAVYEVESSGRGFLINGKPKILFEGHVFWRMLKKQNINPEKFVNGNDDILYPKWTKKYYKGGVTEHERLERAKKINEDCALQSASWGVFQIMGFHYKMLGYNSVKDFVKSASNSERNHLVDFGKFLMKNNLIKYLQEKNWARFAYYYNGSGYKKNRYDTRMASAYKKYC